MNAEEFHIGLTVLKLLNAQTEQALDMMDRDDQDESFWAGVKTGAEWLFDQVRAELDKIREAGEVKS